MSSANSLIPDRETECRVYAMLTMAHALGAEMDRIATLIADKLGIDPSDEAITEAVWNTPDAGTAVMYLKGENATLSGASPCDPPTDEERIATLEARVDAMPSDILQQIEKRRKTAKAAT